MVLTTDALNRSTAYEYDALNRLTAIESPAGSNKRMTFVYNRLGYTVSTTDFLGRTTTMTYNHQGQLTSTTDAVGTISYAYGAAGTLSSVTDELGRVTGYSYDAGLRRIQEWNALYKWIRTLYDAQGRISKVGGALSTPPLRPSPSPTHPSMWWWPQNCWSICPPRPTRSPNWRDASNPKAY